MHQSRYVVLSNDGQMLTVGPATIGFSTFGPAIIGSSTVGLLTVEHRGYRIVAWCGARVWLTANVA